MCETERLDEATRLPWVRREHQERFAFAAGFVAGQVVVDCACGSGVGTRTFLAAGATRVLAFDVAAEAVLEARRDGAGRVLAARADGCHLPLAAECAEVFVSLETLEHVKEDGAFLDEVARVLAPTGVFICSTPDRTVSNPGLPADGRPANPFHVREYSRAEFLALLAARFEQLELHGQNPVPRWRVALLGALGRLVPLRLVTRARQGAKLRYLLPALRGAHAVRPASDAEEYEYLVAVCRGPRR